jgi:3-hydroxyisobutyrate dehydrogenase
MGAPMAANLVKSGFELSVFDVREPIVRDFIRGHPASIAGSLAELGRAAECIITMLPNENIVRDAILGSGGDCVVAGLEPGKIVVDMSTSNPSGTLHLGEALSHRGVRLIDAPVMGGVAFARDASLDIMAGGDRATIDELAAVFAALGRKVYVCGPLGSAHALKAVNNYINATALINLVEGLTIGRKFGLDSALMIETMQAMCAGRNHPLEKKVIPQILTRKYASGMALGFIAKDLKIAVDAARSVGAIAPLAERAHELWCKAAEALGPGVDQTEIVRYWEDASRVKL